MQVVDPELEAKDDVIVGQLPVNPQESEAPTRRRNNDRHDDVSDRDLLGYFRGNLP